MNLTIHFECTSAWDRAKPFLAQSGVQSAFLLNANPEQIQYALDNVSGIVVARVYDPFSERRFLGDNFEKDIILRHEPYEFVNWLNRQDLIRFKGNPRVRFILGWNEMYYAGMDYQKRQNEAMIKVADALIKAGYGVALFGLASDKTIQMADAKAGVWDGVIRFLQDNSQWAHLDCHEYEVGRLASQHLKTYPVGYPRSIEDPVSMRPENWGNVSYSGIEMETNYHMGRIAWLLQRGKFPYARGEMGWDYKADGSLADYIPDYQKRFPRPSGLNTLRPLFNHLTGKQLSDTEFCEAAYRDLEWFASFDPDCLSNAIFADNNGADHAAFNIGLPQYARLYELLGQQREDTPMPFPLFPANVSSKSTSNIRSAANATAPILRVLTTVPIEAKIAREGVFADGYTWLEIQIGEQRGFVAKTANLVVEELATEPIYEINLGFATVRGNAAKIDELATLFEGIAFAVRNAPRVE